MITKLSAVAILSILSCNLLAVEPNTSTESANATVEERFQKLTAELRCVVCQNQSIADSHAELAQDMRNLIHKMMAEGKTDAEISHFLVERYGDFVLYNPPVKPTTYILWMGPLVLLLIGAGGLGYWVRRHAQTTATPPPLTGEERQKINQLLSSNSNDK